MAKTFFITLRQLVVPAGEKESRLASRAAAKLGIPAGDVLSCQPVRRSLDARKRRGKPVMVYHVRLELPNKWRWDLRKAKRPDVVFEPGGHHLSLNLTDPAPGPNRQRPLVVGAGPAGLFAALRLAQAGWRPILIERGDDLDARRGVTAEFWRNGTLDSESNVLFGMGGAGLFSDGKLNTRHKDREGMKEILSTLVQAGAPESVLIDAEPHIGSDLLSDAVANICRFIISGGGEIRTRTRLDALHGDDGALREAVLTAADGGTESVAVDACVLATGHSARDVYFMLEHAGCDMAAKPFAVGLRVEMPQEGIDASQRVGKFKPAAGEAASFRISRPPCGDAGSCYTFCMCPGGLVIACASEPGRLAVNGMSYHARAGEWGNAAFLTPITEADLAGLADAAGCAESLAGIVFQRMLEEKAYLAGRAGGEYCVPASRLVDFADGTTGTLPERRGVGRAVACDLRELLPGHMAATLADAIPAMLGKMRRVDPAEVMLYGTETRTSSPVRVVRDDSGQSAGMKGLFPAGEGSGYAGGIMTSALDGWRAAGKVIQAAGSL